MFNLGQPYGNFFRKVEEMFQFFQIARETKGLRVIRWIDVQCRQGATTTAVHQTSRVRCVIRMGQGILQWTVCRLVVQVSDRLVRISM